MRNLARTIALCALLAIAAIPCGPARADEEGPRQLVTTYMEALKAEDYEKAFEIGGFPLPPALVNAVKELIPKKSSPKLQLPIRATVTDYAIKKVRVDGGLAEVTVEETTLRDADDELKQLLTMMTGSERGIRFGSVKVVETFVLLRLNKKWVFDPTFSGLPFDRLPVAALAAAAERRSGIDSDSTRSIIDFVNGVGIGQMVQTMSSPMVAMMAAVIVPSFARARAQGEYTACRSNLKNIGTALEMYGVDNSGRFPKDLASLTPLYLKRIPTCPAANADTYSAGYTSSEAPHGYTVACHGNHHAAFGQQPDFPAYSSTQGLIEAPLQPQDPVTKPEGEERKDETAPSTTGRPAR